MSPQRLKLVEDFAHAIGEYEGFFLTEEECRRRKITFPTVAQRRKNPGNLRAWGSFPIVDGYVDFDSNESGWKALRRQCDRNIFDRSLTFKEFFGGQRNADGSLINRTSYSGYAPAADRNHPTKYAQYVLNALKTSATYATKDWSNITIDTKVRVLAE